MGIIGMAELGAFEQDDLNLTFIKAHENFLDDLPMIFPNVRKRFVKVPQAFKDIRRQGIFEL